MMLVEFTTPVMVLIALMSNAAAVKSAYTHWGRSDCGPSDTQLVYQGIMAGPAMDKNGGGTDYLCLVLDPSPTAVRASELNGAWLQGTEIFSGSSTNGENLRCAVCAPKYRSAVITIPGKNVCPAGWVKEYAGFMKATPYTNRHPTSFLCLDDQPEFVDGASAVDSSSKLTYAKTDCFQGGTIHHCGNGKYNDQSALLCAVCSQ